MRLDVPRYVPRAGLSWQRPTDDSARLLASFGEADCGIPAQPNIASSTAHREAKDPTSTDARFPFSSAGTDRDAQVEVAAIGDVAGSFGARDLGG